tara:strand:+ start:4186 stop:4395 length:210 start_codon:yes stop_codon:yes gene_type:complete
MKKMNKNRGHSPQAIERFQRVTNSFMITLAKEIENGMAKDIGRGSRVNAIHVESAFGRILLGGIDNDDI